MYNFVNEKNTSTVAFILNLNQTSNPNLVPNLVLVLVPFPFPVLVQVIILIPVPVLIMIVNKDEEYKRFHPTNSGEGRSGKIKLDVPNQVNVLMITKTRKRLQNT